MLVAALIAAVLVMAPPAQAAPTVAPSTCGQGSWIAGTVDICDGELVYRDYVYDDFGARPGLPGLTLPQIIQGLGFQSIPNFDAYGGLPPAGGQKDQDQTDLVALRIRVSGGQVHVSAELNAMTVPSAAKLAIAIDTDGNAAGGGAWPGVSISSAGWDQVHVFDTGDPSTNLIEGQFPQPAGTTWKLWALVAKPDGTPMNVAFRGTDETGWWWEDLQADALAAGDITAMATTVDVADLTGGATHRATPAPGAKRQRVYISQYTLGAGEGIDDAGVPGPGFAPGGPAESVSQAFTMIGKYQPYGFYEPAKPEPHGVQLALHGLAENHSARLYLPGTSGNFMQRFGEDQNRLIATPLGRGWKGWYSSYSERDAFDVLADVEANYPVDTDHVVMSGYSMGGYGAMRLAALHPDLFAGVVNWVGWTGDAFNGTPLAGMFAGGGSGGGADVNAIDLMGSLRHVPMAALYSGADELVHVQSAVDLRQRLSDLHVPSIFYLHPAAEHLTYALFDDWTKESAASASDALVHDPAHITFRTDRRLYEPDLGLVPDRAYWVSAIVPAADGAATVDAVSLGCNGVDEPTTADVPGAGPDPVPWESNEVHVTGFTHRAAANRLELTLTNVSSLHIDLARACLTDPTLDVSVATDQATSITFSNGQTLTFEPETLPRTGATTPELLPLLLALAIAMRLVGRRGGRRGLG
ncbi:MAG: hypothetical protein QOI95_3805 [Acidimicrobiaceae bacterium]|jgi:pimeloyl-ACP methyl ester carboxylesterase